VIDDGLLGPITDHSSPITIYYLAAELSVAAERYDRPLDDVFAIQTDIAKAIADQLQAKLSPAEKRRSNSHRQQILLRTIATCERRSLIW
jgi:hypothetical protein